MRTQSALSTAAGAVVLLALSTIQIQAAEFSAKDNVIVLRDVELRDGDKVISKVYAGKSATVLEVQKDKVRVECGGNAGWLNPVDIASRSDAWRIFSDRIRKDPKDWQALRGRAPLWMDQEKPERALADVDAALALNPRDVQTRRFRAIIHLSSKQYDKAFADISEALRLDPSVQDGYVLRVQALLAKAGMVEFAVAASRFKCELVSSKTDSLSKKDREQVLADLAEELRIRPNDMTFAVRGFVRHFGREYDLAISDANEALRMNPTSGQAFLVRGWAYLEKAEYKKAVADLSEFIKQDPLSPNALGLRINANIMLADYTAALGDESTRLRIAPSATDYFMRAVTRIGQYRTLKPRLEDGKLHCDFAYNFSPGIDLPPEDLALILGDFEGAQKLDPSFQGVFQTRGLLYLWLKDYENSIKDLSESIRLGAKNPIVLVARGLAYSESGQTKLAYADFDEAAKQTSGDQLAVTLRSMAAVRLHKLDEAISELSEIIKANPVSITFVYRGTAWLAKGNMEKAAADFDSAIELDGKSADAHIYRGIVYCADAEYEKGMGFLQEGLRLNPKSALGFAWRSNTWFVKGEHDKALADAERAIELDPKLGDGYARRAIVLFSRSQDRQAAADFEQATQLTLSTTGTKAQAHVGRVLAYLHDQQFEKTLQCCDESLKIFPDNKEMLALRAKAADGLRSATRSAKKSNEGAEKVKR